MSMITPSFGQLNYLGYDDRHIDGGSELPTLVSTIKRLCIYAMLLGIIYVIYTFNPRAAGALYALTFVVLAWRYFDVALALVFACVPFQQDLGGLPIKLALSEINLAILVPVLVIRCGSFPIAWRLVVPAVLYLSFCVAVTLNRIDTIAIKSLIQMVEYLVIAVGVFANSRLKPSDFYKSFDALIVVCTIFCLVGIATRFHAMGIHKNGWGASISLGLIVAFEMWQNAIDEVRKRWLFVCVCILTLGLVLTVSRGGWLAAMAGIGSLLLLRRDFETLTRLAMAVVPIAAIGWFLLPEDLQEYAVGFESKRYNIRLRWQSVNHALNLWYQSPWIGTGVGLRKQYDATNVVLLLLAETGVIGLLLFALIHANIAWFVWTNHKWFNSHSTSFSCMALGGSLVAARLAHGLVDHYWSRGAILAAWAAVGMAVACYKWELEQDEQAEFE